MYRFAFYYTDLHRSSLDQFTTQKKLKAYLDDQDILPQFIKLRPGSDYKDIRFNTSTIKAYVQDLSTMVITNCKN